MKQVTGKRSAPLGGENYWKGEQECRPSFTRSSENQQEEKYKTKPADPHASEEKKEKRRKTRTLPSLREKGNVGGRIVALDGVIL